MPSFSPRTRRLALGALGAALLLAAVFAPVQSTAVAYTHQYDVETVSADRPNLADVLEIPERTADCSREQCPLAHEAVTNGSQVVHEVRYERAYALDGGFALVIFEGRDRPFYRTNITHYDNNSVGVALEPVSNATALDLASTSARHYPAATQRLLERGRVRTDHALAGYALWTHTHAILAYEGDHYRQSFFEYRGSADSVEAFVRLFLLLSGALLCYAAGRTRVPEVRDVTSAHDEE
ncbi:hypothetical protein [Halarchaeum sp. P4]|uniref:hypothetical protein n=1 Tax=Halarchaeum sp. P4 TaxID=3421639 RepID=UPI003EB94669